MEPRKDAQTLNKPAKFQMLLRNDCLYGAPLACRKP
jgi:hypothetical protein